MDRTSSEATHQETTQQLTLEALQIISQTRLPPEIWARVVGYLPQDDLKRVRLVNSTFSDFATPRLFQTICFSFLPENLALLGALAKNKSLCQRVERLQLDTSTYCPLLRCAEYVKGLSNGFADALGVPAALFKDGPLSAPKLLTVLEMDSSWPLSDEYLSGNPRAQFREGYAQYCARGYFQSNGIQSDAIYKQLIHLLPSFPTLRHAETLTEWTRSNNFGDNFESYLWHNLPASTFRQIPGLDGQAIPRASLQEGVHGSNIAPGFSARHNNFMTGRATDSGCFGHDMTFEIVSAFLRATHDKEVKLNTLSLPGPDCIGHESEARLRKGMVPVPAVCGAPPVSKHKTSTLLLPLFKNLQKLELQIDHLHPGTNNLFDYDVNWQRVPQAIQSMKMVETLNIGYKITPPVDGQPNPEPFSLYQTLLRRPGDYETEGPEDDGPPPNDGNMPTQAEFLNLLSGIFGAAPPPTGENASGTSAGATAGPAPNAHTSFPPNIAPLIPQTSLLPNGNTATSMGFSVNLGSLWSGIVPPPTDTSSSAAKYKEPSPEDVFSPNPWPALKHLSLWNMPARKFDIIRLLKAIGCSLKTLKLYNVYFTNTSGGEDADDDEGNETMPPLEEVANKNIKQASVPLSQSSGVLLKSLSKLPKVDTWFETIEALGDIPLGLSKCEIELGEHDWDRLDETLSTRVEGFDCGSVDVDEALSSYLLHENNESRAMGFALHVAGMVKETEAVDVSMTEEWPNSLKAIAEDQERVKRKISAQGIVISRADLPTETKPTLETKPAAQTKPGKGKEPVIVDDLAEGEGESEWEDSDDEDDAADDLADEGDLQSVGRRGWGGYGTRAL